MSRGIRNTRRHYVSGHEEEKESFWVSYTDLMSGLVIIFALVLMVSVFTMQGAYEKAEASIKKKEATIQEQNKMIDEIVGVKGEIIDELVEAFQDSNLDLQVDRQTGTIKLSGGVLFKSNSTEMSPGGEQYLREFIPKYVGVLMSDQFKGEISQIIVEGHTNKVGDYLFNLNLSQGRALSVVELIFSPSFPNFEHKEELTHIITANGRSHSVPVLDANGKIDAEKSRRVEFKFRLKDEQLLEKIQTLVNGVKS
ncbi:flagellar motor protein MotB [Heyndrickxia sp. MSNUG]|uniref:OmpA/MotB family protein n=1 Tax=Heyndrickxia sp. MSNUG TaxID=3136677 RepID=UPI003C2C6B0B